jgi:Rho termination factor, N-terminal domain
VTVLRFGAEVEVSPLLVGKNTGKRKEDDMAKDHGPSIKDDEQYEALRREGESKEKAARIANAGSRSSTGRKGGKAGDYEDRSKEDLLKKARQVGIEGRSKMSKRELISALRNH